MAKAKKTNISKIIDTNHSYFIDDIFNNERIIAIVNDFNGTNLKAIDCVFDNVDDKTISFYVKSIDKKYEGRVTIKYKKDKHLPYIISMCSLLFIMLCFIVILLPCAILYQHTSLLCSGLGIFLVDLIAILALLIIWPNNGKKHIRK